MYIIDKENNSLVRVEKCSFKDLGMSERENLQEWIAKEPSSLGEDLLIIQKEFDGFSDTRERLDLLALDKLGNLVIIENKLDDSGRDVTWQAIKYASYCSSLTKQDIIEIYQRYLGTSANAEEMLSEFFDDKELSDIEINVGNSQRIFFVAANFRKEVTSSVMWLLNFNLRIKCFKVTPYKYNDKLLLDFDQIIPIKDADDYTIKIASKKQSESQDSEANRIRNSNRQKFWAEFIEYNRQHNGLYRDSSDTSGEGLSKNVKGLAGINPRDEEDCLERLGRRYPKYGKSGEQVKLALADAYKRLLKPSIETEFAASSKQRADEEAIRVFTTNLKTNVNVLIFKNNIRAEVYISSADRERSKRLFDYLYDRKEEIEQQFGDSLTWQRLDDKKACRIRIDRNDLSYLEPEQQEEIFAFFLDTSNKLMKAFAPYAKKYNDQ